MQPTKNNNIQNDLSGLDLSGRGCLFSRHETTRSWGSSPQNANPNGNLTCCETIKFLGKNAPLNKLPKAVPQRVSSLAAAPCGAHFSPAKAEENLLKSSQIRTMKEVSGKVRSTKHKRSGRLVEACASRSCFNRHLDNSYSPSCCYALKCVSKMCETGGWFHFVKLRQTPSFQHLLGMSRLLCSMPHEDVRARRWCSCQPGMDSGQHVMQGRRKARKAWPAQHNNLAGL